MLKTNNKKVRERVRAYIMEEYNSEVKYPFPLEQPTTFHNVATNIYKVYSAEAARWVKNDMDDFIEWLCGLPAIMACSHVYTNYYKAADTVGDMLEETAEERARFDNNQACYLLNSLIYKEIRKEVEQ